MIRHPPRSTRTAPLCPYRALCRSEIAAERGIARQWQYARVAPTSRVEERRGCFGRGHLSLGHFRGHLFFHAAGTVAAKSLVPSGDVARSDEHTSELQSLMRISYAAFCLTKKKTAMTTTHPTP